MTLTGIEKLRPKNVLITGGASGIGLATAELLLKKGVKGVVLLGRNAGKLEKAKAGLADRRVKILQFDIKDVPAMDGKIAQAQELLGAENQIDGLVSSAGVFFPDQNWRGFNLSEEEWDNVMNTNLKGTFFFMRKVVNKIVEAKLKGSVCIVSSATAHSDTTGPYQLSKNAISRIVQAFGKHLGEHGVVLNGVEPWIVKDDMSPMDGITDGIIPGRPLPSNSIQRCLRPDEIAEMIFVCMSEFGETLAGTCVTVGGGVKGMFSW